MRAHWALHELGLDYDARLVASRSGETQSDEFGRLNPKRKIPVLARRRLHAHRERRDRHLPRRNLRGRDSGFVPAPATRDRARYDEASASS